ncbi:hypothetical protein CO046_05605 [Candidatus Peregrinibacteria bacterium CG_4_9_14_0_2_um_filter_53_11]|nr:MAG: hypothetical protein CO046_05605 [Candidatus Peregrinibacteria bacterium CG_4_9_14_0_2_um_filter_53_11]
MKNTSRPKRYLALALTALMLTLTGGALLTARAQSGDTTEPDDVVEVSAQPGDAEILLQWQPATDNVGVTAYKIYAGTQPVVVDGDVYNLPTLSTGNVTQYTVSNLTNGQPYYFSVTAVDAAGNESISYSPEATATPRAGLQLAGSEDNGQAPQVTEVVAVDGITVRVVFSEAVQLPEEQPESAFTIETATEGTRLAVQRAEMDTEDETDSTLLLTTAPQTAGVEYVLTAGIEVKDLLDNPVISGTSDTGSFDGLAVTTPPNERAVADEPAASESDTTPPTVISAVADFNDRIAVTFSEPVVPSDTIGEQIKVVKAGTAEADRENPINILALTNISLSVDETVLYLTTAPQAPVDYEITLGGLTDKAGNELSALDAPTTVSGRGAGVEDLIPPEDVTEFVARVKDLQKSIIELKWKESANTAGDLADYRIYQGTGENTTTFGEGQSLGSTTSSVEVQNLEPGSWYSFRLSATDQTGNESPGTFTSVFLPKTGPGVFAAGVTGVLMGLYRKRKKRRQ